jgi:hypothetical protein
MKMKHPERMVRNLIFILIVGSNVYRWNTAGVYCYWDRDLDHSVSSYFWFAWNSFVYFWCSLNKAKTQLKYWDDTYIQWPRHVIKTVEPFYYVIGDITAMFIKVKKITSYWRLYITLCYTFPGLYHSHLVSKCIWCTSVVFPNRSE